MFERNEKGILVPSSKIAVAGKYVGQIIRAGKVIDEFEADNLVTDEGLNHTIATELTGGTQITSWYLGVFEGNYTPIASDAAANIASRATETTAYASATRPAYTPGAVSGKAVDNSASRASFVFNASKTIYGAFLASSATKSGTSGVVFSAARFASAKQVDSADEMLLTYQFTAATV